MEVFLADLVAAQRARGDEVVVLVHGLPLPDDPPWLKRVPVLCQAVYAPLAPVFPFALRRLLREFEPQVLHLHMPNPSAFSALLFAAALRVPWVVHWHADVVAAKGRARLSLAYRLYRPFEQLLLARAARVIATSPPYLDASEPLKRWRDKCSVIPLGLDLSRYPAQPDMKQDSWTCGAFRVLAVGRLSHYKDFPTLVRAVSGLTGVELLLAGDGEQRSELEALADAAQGRVRLLGAVSDARKDALLANCDVLCLASIERSEAFGLVLLEAMRYARPCIVSELPGSGMPWVVREAQAGLLAKPGDVADWRRALTLLRDDARMRGEMGERAARSVHRLFSMQACADAVARQYTLAGVQADTPTPRRGLLVVIPARNEAPTLPSIVAELIEAGHPDIVVIDDHSTDGTGEAAERAGATVLRAALPLGAWGGMQAGIRHAIAHGYSSVITMDADGQHDVAAIRCLLAERDKADVVIGAHPARASYARRIAWNWFRRISGLAVEDLTSGFRLYNATAMQLAVSEAATQLDFQDVGVLLMLRRAGLRLAEVPVPMNPRIVDRSRVFDSWWTVTRYMAATTLLCLARRPYRPVPRRSG
ncbi:glycosyl transferase family 1 [Pseudazoarcus pumilus]|uniref:Glycosyl transferase family 1 n=2 Tax=Pseudazoarcus pumilus TaxID=2067960 RepID=A0A2I6SB17_9RHOO|nr:glycosyl transferase family 1 [Pseudazoarcus pumilus]